MASSGNFCTMNPLAKSPNATVTKGNLYLPSVGYPSNVLGTMGVSSGKWYWELRLVDPYASIYWGLHGVHNVITQSVFSGGAGFYALNSSGGGLYANGSLVTAKASGWATGDIIGLAYDADNLTLGVYQNNSQIGSNLTVPDAFNFPVYFQNASGGDTSSFLYIFGQDDTFAGAISATGNTDGNGVGVFKYAPPSGYLALCTANLPEPTISPNETTQADDYFNTLLYTGDGNNTRSITGVGFQPDWVWLKRRSSAQNHRVFDIVSGTNGSATVSTPTSASTVTPGYTPSGSYGKFLPDVGLIVLNPRALQLSGSQGGVGLVLNDDLTDNALVANHSALFENIKLAQTFSLNSEETITSDYIFVRVRNSDFNYSTNPSMISGSGEFVYSSLINNPQTFVTTVGLYNDSNELLSVAKLSKPLVKDFTKEALVRVKLDF